MRSIMNHQTSLYRKSRPFDEKSTEFLRLSRNKNDLKEGIDTDRSASRTA